MVLRLVIYSQRLAFLEIVQHGIVVNDFMSQINFFRRTSTIVLCLWASLAGQLILCTKFDSLKISYIWNFFQSWGPFRFYGPFITVLWLVMLISVVFRPSTRPKCHSKVMHRKEETHSNGSYEKKSRGWKLADEMGRGKKNPIVHS